MSPFLFADMMKEAIKTDIAREVKDAMTGWLDNMKDAQG